MGLTGFRTLLAVLGTALFIGMAPALAISGCLGGTERINLGIAGIGISGLFLSFFFDGTGGGADGNTDGGNTGMSRKDFRLLLSTIGSAVLLGSFPAMMAIDLSGGSDLLIFGAACVGTVGFILLLLGETGIRESGAVGEAEVRTGWKVRPFLSTIGTTVLLCTFPATMVVFCFEGPEWSLIGVVVALVVAFLLPDRRAGGEDGDGGDGAGEPAVGTGFPKTGEEDRNVRHETPVNR